MNKAFTDIKAMSKRCITLSIRNPDTILTSIVAPVLMLLLFVYVLGGSMISRDISYVNYIVPGILLQCIGQCSSVTAISVSTDIKNGIVDRFRTMPISSTSFLTGHIVESVVRNSVTCVAIIAISFFIGFRPTGSLLECLVAGVLLLLYVIGISWVSVIFGLIAHGPEGAGGFAIFTILLPYLSSGFVSTDTMPSALRWFAENQPMTPIIESIRRLFMNEDLGNNLVVALVWILGILVIGNIVALMIFKRKTK